MQLHGLSRPYRYLRDDREWTSDARDDLRRRKRAGDVARRAQRYPGIEEDGRRRVLAGETSIEEVLRVTAVA